MQCDAKTIIESISTAILVTDSQLKIAFANSAAEQLFSTSRTKLQGLKLLDLIDKNEKNLAESLQNYDAASFQGFTANDITFTPDPHEHFHADMYISLYSGRARGLLVEIHRLDYQQKLNDDLQRRSQNLAARDLIRNLAHEIKNPLGGIRGAAQLLEMLHKQDDELKEYTKVIIEQADRLKSLVDRLLGPQRPNPRTMSNIHYVIEKVLSLEQMATKGTLRFDKDYDPSLPELLLDVDAMQQALLNIISNAIQALTEAHTTYPTIKIKTRALMGALVNGTKYPMSIEVDILDNGPGIPEKIKKMLFYPMVTTRAEGHGLGLSIAQNIVEHHQGTIECESQPGCTTFKIILPISGDHHKGNADAANANVTAPAAAPATAKIGTKLGATPAVAATAATKATATAPASSAASTISATGANNDKSTKKAKSTTASAKATTRRATAASASAQDVSETAAETASKSTTAKSSRAKTSRRRSSPSSSKSKLTDRESNAITSTAKSNDKQQSAKSNESKSTSTLTSTSRKSSVRSTTRRSSSTRASKTATTTASKDASKAGSAAK